jgi:1,4-alpha-glucan branching enzyme
MNFCSGLFVALAAAVWLPVTTRAAEQMKGGEHMLHLQGIKTQAEADAPPQASQVFIVGSFDDWCTNDLPMIRLVDGNRAKDLTLPPGRYEYLFVLDDAWVPDPAATETVPNPFFGVDAVVIVPERNN